MRGSFQETTTTLSLGHLTLDQRLATLREKGFLDDDDLTMLEGRNLRQWGEELEFRAENVIAAYAIPLGLATHFVINGEQLLIPMATEERSVVAAAAKAAKLTRSGFTARVATNLSHTRAQILFADLPQPQKVHDLFQSSCLSITKSLQAKLTNMDKYGGGLRSISSKMFEDGGKTFVVLNLEIDTGEAMGANVVTKMAEKAASYLIPFTGRPHIAAICSNRSTGCYVRADAVWSSKDVPFQTLERILMIQAWARNDIDRCYTHNKGIMNAVSAIALATGQDTRAIEASCHGYAMTTGMYQPLSHFEPVTTDDGPALKGSIHLTLPIGTVGGATGMPMAAFCRKLMGDPKSQKLACMMAAAGLAQNFGALRALASEGIPESHRLLAARKR